MINFKLLINIKINGFRQSINLFEAIISINSFKINGFRQSINLFEAIDGDNINLVLNLLKKPNVSFFVKGSNIVRSERNNNNNKTYSYTPLMRTVNKIILLWFIYY